jgi:UDP-N-acetylglucosamine:LPS N-acetylglucosamine transferase
MVIAAALLGYPTAIQEQNSAPGITNQVLGKFMRAVFIAFEDAARTLNQKRRSRPHPKTPLRPWPRRARGGQVLIDDMATAYAESNLVGARDGAFTLAELPIAGKP